MQPVYRLHRDALGFEVFKDLFGGNGWGVPVQAVHRLRQCSDEYDMVLAVIDRSEGKNPIFSVKTVVNLSGISLEKPYKSKVVGQCHNCQLFGHSQCNCFATPRCLLASPPRDSLHGTVSNTKPLTAPKVAQIPALMDVVVPTPPLKSGPTAQPARPKAPPAPAAPAATPSIPTRSAQANFDIVRVAFDIVASEDTAKMAAEILACGSDLNRLNAVFQRLPEITNGLNFLRSQRNNPQ
ncbi:hypothetical protein PYW07_013227 [Mythimna separata]|uniref:Uncharacterized protein n=1 Tax=Mythimna separata TaxID=271217 RepID=A0AAD7Y634_MYTSE|nr:hypothetical protein PYW07_013227 [Mythimna separata]